MKCKRCDGFMIRDEEGDSSCVICGGVIVKMRRAPSVPLGLQKKEGTFIRARRT